MSNTIITSLVYFKIYKRLSAQPMSLVYKETKKWQDYYRSVVLKQLDRYSQTKNRRLFFYFLK